VTWPSTVTGKGVSQSPIEIRSKGGIIAESRVFSLKVYPVQVVSRAPKTRRENGSSRQPQPGEPKTAAFHAVLKEAIAENQPIDCYTVTYNAGRTLQTYFYQPSREYTF